ncbi:heterogeneous nuclear ribonucleoprotein 1 [Ipomoea triloba]|uniref:heterogeneous nuclear ribonucleoprotein 1 n=1 Tax=Ipomoea triloba TaxID=35885 RepID=UPI00125E69DF|nr:heterogeneous nuclear ribonucleoprotein 1 [Ipomoea triloba]
MQSDLGKLFIGGISWDTTEEHLKEYFSAYGEVLEAVIMKDRTTGRARGFGFIVFADPTVAERVIKEKHNIDGRMVEAKKAVPRDDQSTMSRSSNSIQGSPGPRRTRKIFVGGLASTVTESDFKKYFEQFGTITDVVVMYDHNTQRPRGFGFITYDSEDAVDKVLLKTFHELNGKMVEVKRAVPKELSPGPSRSPLGGYNYGLSRINNFLNSYTQAYSPNAVGGYGVRMDNRFSPMVGGRSNFAPFASGYGMGLNFEPGLSPGYGGSANFNTTLNYGRGPYYVNNSSRFGGLVGLDGGNGGNSSFFSSTRDLWGNGGLNYGTNSTNSSNFGGSGNGNLGGGAMNNRGVWGSSTYSAQGGGGNVSGQSGNLGYGSADNSYGLTGGTYGRNVAMSGGPTSSYAASNGSYERSFADFYDNDFKYTDPTWGSANSERDGSGSFGYGPGNTPSEMPAQSAAGSVCSYGVTNRQNSRGI